MGKISTENLLIKEMRNNVDEYWNKVSDKIEDVQERIKKGDNRTFPLMFEDHLNELINDFLDYSEMVCILDELLDIQEGIKTQEEVLNPDEDDEES